MKKFYFLFSFLLFLKTSFCCKNYSCPPLYILNKKTCYCDPARKPHLCKRSCREGLVITPFCECKKPVICTAIACREGTIKDPSTCICVPIRRVKPFPLCLKICKPGYVLDRLTCTCKGPFVDCSRKCPYNHVLTEDCRCEPIRPQKCGIRKCKWAHILDKRKCACVEKSLGMCKILCRDGMRVYPGHCKCVPEIKCPIKRCRPGYRRSRRKCRCISRINSRRK